MVSPTWIVCGGIALAFVGTLYIAALPSSCTGLGRDHPSTIKRRCCAVAFTCTVAWLPYYFSLRSDDMLLVDVFAKLGLRLTGVVASSTYPLLLTATLFLGPILQAHLDGATTYKTWSCSRFPPILVVLVFAVIVWFRAMSLWGCATIDQQWFRRVVCRWLKVAMGK